MMIMGVSEEVREADWVLEEERRRISFAKGIRGREGAPCRASCRSRAGTPSSGSVGRLGPEKSMVSLGCLRKLARVRTGARDDGVDLARALGLKWSPAEEMEEPRTRVPRIFCQSGTKSRTVPRISAAAVRRRLCQRARRRKGRGNQFTAGT